MSTIASPRQSLTLSARRDSDSTDNTTRSASTSRPPPVTTGSVRRNRTALRDYYGLKSTSKEPESGTATPIEVEKDEEIDREGFDASGYVKNLLANESLESILRAEASLVSETRNLDGEKKALIYDNYSKLIAATQTIRKMRMNMDPLSPTTSTLTPAISHIAETATELSDLLRQQHGVSSSSESNARQASLAQKQLVQWVLAGPDRVKSLVANNNLSTAEKEWEQIAAVIDKWPGVKGVDDLRAECLSALRGEAKG